MNAQPSFRYQLAIGTGLWGLEWTWNARFGYWTLRIETADGVPIASGIKVLERDSLLDHVHADGLPDAVLAVIKLPEHTRIERDDLGNTAWPYALTP